MEHDVKISKAKEAVANATLDLEIRKDKYVQVRSTEKNLKGTREKAYLPPPNPY